ncbi:MAG: hypothetical protein AB7G93_12930 [Bdellovibrionales bacterium]
MRTIFAPYPPYGEGPGTILARTYGQEEPLANIAEGIGYMETGFSKMYRWAPPVYETRLEPDPMMDKLFQESTAIVGVDALYMSAVKDFNDCEYGERTIRDTLERFVNKSYQAGKILILGTVPKEDPTKMSTAAKLVVGDQIEACRQILNKALRDACEPVGPSGERAPSRNCYIVDIEALVSRLHATGQLELNDGTILKESPGFSSFFVNEVRPDGVNLSERGVQVLVEKILDRLEAYPPQPVQKGPMLQVQ